MSDAAARLPGARRAFAFVGLLLIGSSTLYAGEPPDESERLLRVARQARAGVVRIRWQDDRNAEDERVRNAIVVSSAGHLLLAGPRPAYARGTIYAEFANGDTVKARFVDWDEGSGLTLLHVNYRNLEPLRFRPEPLAPAAADEPAPQPAPPAPPVAAPALPGVLDRPKPDAGATPTLRRQPLGTLAIGMPVVMVTGTGAVAQGTVRAQDRQIQALNPDTGLPRTLGALVEAGMAVLASDQGSPWLDRDGNVAALQVATGYAAVLPEQLEAAGATDLRPRISPSAALAVPASVLRVVTPRLLARKPVRRAGLGIHSHRCDRTTRDHLTDGYGCHVIRKVDPKGPAARAGIQPLDVIVRVNGVRLRPGARLLDVLLPFRPGDRVQLGILRKGRELEIDCALAVR